MCMCRFDADICHRLYHLRNFHNQMLNSSQTPVAQSVDSREEDEKGQINVDDTTDDGIKALLLLNSIKTPVSNTSMSNSNNNNNTISINSINSIKSAITNPDFLSLSVDTSSSLLLSTGAKTRLKHEYIQEAIKNFASNDSSSFSTDSNKRQKVDNNS
jgi:hypothetical protein